VSSRDAYGSASWNPGKYSEARPSSDTFFSSAIMATAAAVNALDDDPMANTVRSSTGWAVPTVRTP
jgi:hypothetical protein